MPIGTPSVPYRLPGSQYERWVDIYTRLGVERILIDPGLGFYYRGRSGRFRGLR